MTYRYSNCFMVLLNQRHKYGASGGTESTVEMGTVPNFATNSDPTPGDRTSSRRHRILGKPIISETRNLLSEEKGLKSNGSLPTLQFAKNEISSLDTDLSSTPR